MSSLTGEGLDGLLRKIERLLDGQNQIKKYLIPHHAYHYVAKVRQEGCLRMMESNEEGTYLEASPRGRLAVELEDYLLAYD